MTDYFNWGSSNTYSTTNITLYTDIYSQLVNKTAVLKKGDIINLTAGRYKGEYGEVVRQQHNGDPNIFRIKFLSGKQVGAAYWFNVNTGMRIVARAS